MSIHGRFETKCADRFHAASRQIVIWRPERRTSWLPLWGSWLPRKGQTERASGAIILLRYPLSQPVRLTALPKGEPRGAAVSARQITIFPLADESRYTYGIITHCLCLCQRDSSFPLPFLPKNHRLPGESSSFLQLRYTLAISSIL